MGERPYCSSSVGAANGRPFLNRRCSSCFLTATQIGDSTLGAAQGELPEAREGPLGDNSAARIVSLEIVDSTCEYRHLVTFIFVGAVCDNTLTNCATRVCRACWK